MSAVLRSELLKQRTTRTILQLPLWMAGLVALVVLLHVFSLDVATLTGRAGQLKVLGWGTSIGALFAALLGVLSITGEIRHGTIRPTFLATPRRTRVIIAKVAAGALAGLAIGLLAEALTVGLESAGLAARGIHIALTGGDYLQLLAGGAVCRAVGRDRRRRDRPQPGRRRPRAVRVAAADRNHTDHKRAGRREVRPRRRRRRARRSDPDTKRLEAAHPRARRCLPPTPPPRPPPD